MKNVKWKNRKPRNFEKIKKEDRTIEINNEYLNLFESYIKEVKKEGIKLVLVAPPHYILGQKMYINYDEILHILVFLVSRECVAPYVTFLCKS